jgi:signal transduction histidine kinase
MHVADTPHTPWHQRGWLRRLLIVCVFNAFITVMLYLLGPARDPLARQALYSFCIGTSIWLCIEAALRLAERPDTDIPTPLVVLCSISGVLVGLVLGTSVADTLMGRAPLSFWGKRPDFAGGLLVLSLTCGLLGSVYFVGQARLAALREKAEAAQRQATQAQLTLLQSQLEPHMLFNTLANLRALIAIDPARATEMLDHLNDFLRATLAASRSSAATHTLRDEFDRLRDYLELMAVRMGPRLRFQLDLPPDLQAHPVLPLLLQPLVENAIKHGLEPAADGGRIDVTARRDGPHLVLTVADTGVGNAAALQALLNHGSTGFGLAQVRERLLHHYAKGLPDSSLVAIEFIAGSAGGISAVVRFPLQS